MLNPKMRRNEARMTGGTAREITPREGTRPTARHSHCRPGPLTGRAVAAPLRRGAKTRRQSAVTTPERAASWQGSTMKILDRINRIDGMADKVGVFHPVYPVHPVKKT